jgi:SNF family Na+-dependent transporter
MELYKGCDCHCLADRAKMTESQPRDRWPSRATFLVASIGAAVGLGNIWRFPYLTYKHGGGAFLIPYWIFMITLGHPILQAELALGVPSTHLLCASAFPV